jgi:hypothetical protein
MEPNQLRPWDQSLLEQEIARGPINYKSNLIDAAEKARVILQTNPACVVPAEITEPQAVGCSKGSGIGCSSSL